MSPSRNSTRGTPLASSATAVSVMALTGSTIGAAGATDGRMQRRLGWHAGRSHGDAEEMWRSTAHGDDGCRERCTRPTPSFARRTPPEERPCTDRHVGLWSRCQPATAGEESTKWRGGVTEDLRAHRTLAVRVRRAAQQAELVAGRRRDSGVRHGETRRRWSRRACATARGGRGADLRRLRTVRVVPLPGGRPTILRVRRVRVGRRVRAVPEEPGHHDHRRAAAPASRRAAVLQALSHFRATLVEQG